MLQFYYHFIDKHINSEDFASIQKDAHSDDFKRLHGFHRKASYT